MNKIGWTLNGVAWGVSLVLICLDNWIINRFFAIAICLGMVVVYFIFTYLCLDDSNKIMKPKQTQHKIIQQEKK